MRPNFDDLDLGQNDQDADDCPESGTASDVQLGDKASTNTTGSMVCVRPLDSTKTTVVAYKPGAVGLRMRWSDVDQALVVQGFPRLPSGGESVAEACGVLAIGMVLRCVGKKVLVGLSHEEVLAVLSEEVEGDAAGDVLLEFGQGSGVYSGYSGDEMNDAEAFLHRVARSVEEELRGSSPVWKR